MFFQEKYKNKIKKLCAGNNFGAPIKEGAFDINRRWIKGMFGFGFGFCEWMNEWAFVESEIWLGKLKQSPPKTPKPCLALRFVVAMDFQVVVLGGGVSKKLLPLVSQVSQRKCF